MLNARPLIQKRVIITIARYRVVSPVSLLILFTGLFCICSSQDHATATVLELPKFVVPASPDLLPVESWRYAQLDGLQILSNASEPDAERLVREFWRFNQALGIAWPELRGRSAVPMSLILCNRHSEFANFVPAAADRGDFDSALASVYLEDGERSAIVLDLDARVVHISDASSIDPASAITGAHMEGIRVDHRQQLYREYVHFLISSSQSHIPAWLEEGLAQLVMGMTFNQNSIIFAKLEDPNQQSVEAYHAAVVRKTEITLGTLGLPPPPPVPAEDRGFQAALQNSHVAGLREMFAVAHNSETARKPLGSLWAKQCYAFVHLCLYGRHPQLQKEFIAFVTRCAQEPVTESLFRECFKMGYKEMELELRAYIAAADYKSIEWKIHGGLPAPPKVAFREATPGEVGCIKGEALRLAGRVELAGRTFVSPYIRGERDPQLLGSLGLSELTAGRYDRAQKFLDAAAAANVLRPRVYYGLARLRYSAALAKPEAQGKLSAAQVESVLTPLFVARSQPPPLAEVYVLIADAWAHSAVAPTSDNLAVLMEGVRLFPRAVELLYPTAGLYANAGLTAQARSLADLGLRASASEEGKSQFNRLKAAMKELNPSGKFIP